MFLITGGLGFIGSHTAQAFLDLGESCVLVQRRKPELPDAFADEAGKRVFVEQVDIGDQEAFLEIGARHTITGIVHLAGSVPWPPGAFEPIDGTRLAIDSLLTVITAARAWDVPRVGVASTIGVYHGAGRPSPLTEDMPLPMTSGHVIPAFKKIGELLTDHLAGAMEREIINYRISAIWGPRGHSPSPFFAAPQLVHAAARGTAPDLRPPYASGYAEDGIDMCYVKDCGRAIALLHLAENLNHRTYNVAAGHPTTNAEVLTAIREVVPDAGIELPTGHDPDGPDTATWLDITRIRQDTGYQPAYDIERAVADYIDWLRTGHHR